MKRVIVVALFMLSVVSVNFANATEVNVVPVEEANAVALSVELSETAFFESLSTDTECSCMLDEDSSNCEKLGATIGVMARFLTDWGAETIDKLEQAITEICEIWMEEE